MRGLEIKCSRERNCRNTSLDTLNIAQKVGDLSLLSLPVGCLRASGEEERV